MKKWKKILRTPVETTLLLLVAIGLLGYSSIGGARAAISIFSGSLNSQIALSNIGLTLMEGSTAGDMKSVSGSNSMLTHLKGIQLGKEYGEYIAVQNTGDIDEYVRVTIYKYWKDENGKKMDYNKAFSPDLIELTFNTGGGWTEDAAARTDERQVFYYSGVLPANGGQSAPLTTAICISDKAGGAVVYSSGGSIASRYKGKTFVVEAVADAVQDHHANDADGAKVSAWGQVR